MWKKFSLFLIALLFVCSYAFADMSDEATLGGVDSSGNYRFRVNSSGTLIPATTSGIQVINEAMATGDTLTAAETGKRVILTQTGVVTLPAAETGLEYTIIAGSGVKIEVNPGSSDKIKYLTMGAGDKIVTTSEATGDSITLVCARANSWDISNKVGTWIDGE